MIMPRRAEREPGWCALDVALVWEVFDSGRSAMLYPINHLRNLARLQVRWYVSMRYT